MNYFQKRLAEPSTHASLGTAFLLASIIFPSYAAALQAAAAAFAGVGAAMPELNAAAVDPSKFAAFIPPVDTASNPAIAAAISVGVHAAIAHLLTPPAKK
jgi:hypothetical protein